MNCLLGSVMGSALPSILFHSETVHKSSSSHKHHREEKLANQSRPEVCYKGVNSSALLSFERLSSPSSTLDKLFLWRFNYRNVGYKKVRAVMAKISPLGLLDIPGYCTLGNILHPGRDPELKTSSLISLDVCITFISTKAAYHLFHCCKFIDAVWALVWQDH